jgi:hypothetical protein
MERYGTAGNERTSEEREGTKRSFCEGVVQLVRTPYSHPEPQIMRGDFHSRRGDAHCGNRCEVSADSGFRWLVRIAANRHPTATNKNAKHAMFSGRVSSSGDELCSRDEHSDVVWKFQDSTIRASRGAECLCDSMGKEESKSLCQTDQLSKNRSLLHS